MREALAVPVRVAGLGGRQPMSFGVPMPKGTVHEPIAAVLADPEGEAMPVQTGPLVFWPDGSVQWLRVDAMLPDGARDGDWSLRVEGTGHQRDEPEGEAADAPRATRGPWGVRVLDRTDAIAVETAAAEFEALRDEFRFRSHLGCASDVRLALTDARGRRHEPIVERVEIEARGPVRATVLVHGAFPRAGVRTRVRWTCFAGSALVRADVTLHNPRRAKHKGNIWDLGDAGSVLFEDFSLEVSLPDVEAPEAGWIVTDQGPGDEDSTV
ncbi:MAG: hypothetical protein ACREIV_03685, partial [Planctomycetaceae bacterium]